MKILMLLASVVACSVFHVLAKDSDLMEDRSFRTSNGMTVNYLLFTPKEYDPSKKYPLVVTLHGSGSDYKYQVDNNDQAHPWIEDSIQAEVPHFIMAPGCPGGTWGGMMGAGSELSQEARAIILTIEELETEFSLDTTRFIICGFSLGGAGTYHQIQFMPDFWAAALPSAAGGSADNIEVISETPIWHHQGANDGGGGALTRMANALKAKDYPILRIDCDLVINSPSSWNSEIQKGTKPEDIIFRNASPSYDDVNKAIEAGERYIFQMIRNGSHEDARINANHNPLIAKWAFMQSKGTTALRKPAPKAVVLQRREHRAALTLGTPSNLIHGRIFTLLGQECRTHDAAASTSARRLQIRVISDRSIDQ